jgi:hypothetical protein
MNENEEWRENEAIDAQIPKGPVPWKFETVAIIVPSVTRDGQVWSREKHDNAVGHVRRMLAEMFGGCTATKAKGAWRDPDTGLMSYESVTRVESWVDPAHVEGALSVLIEHAKRLRQEWDQGEVALVVGNSYYGITAEVE